MLLPRPLLRPTISTLTLSTPPKTRTFTTTPPREASVLFALHALSNSRETQHFNKISHLNRIEHSPNLKLIKTSEVDPYPLPTPPPPRPAVPQSLLGSRHGTPANSAARVWNDRALRVGRVILADQARRTHRLHRSLRRAKHRSSLTQIATELERDIWRQEAQRHRREMRSAGLLILASVGVATGLATWRFWPGEASRVDSGELGRRIAAKAQRSLEPLGGITKAGAGVGGVSSQVGARSIVTASPAAAVEHGLASVQPTTVVPEANVQSKSWWKGLFWKQQ
ncbi:hypothetical protein LTR86_009612 [Recurvomyces mirabilis]|nr:hypothetical protein LTR86_009612 [Recurvomyces mirabilis]